MSKYTCTCGKKVDEEDVYTVQMESLCRDCYLGKTGHGPLAEQYHACATCGQTIHKFTAFCPKCKNPVREIGKVESAARGSATKGIGFVVAIVVLSLAFMVLANRAAERGMSLGAVIPMASGAFLLGVNGLLGLLYFRYFAIATFIRGIPGFVAGGLSFILSAVLLFLLV
ncbi:MAG: hypothetical protein ABI333_03660 [bacterium]